MLYALFAASWDFLAGIAGQVSFGHSLFWGVSIFAYAHMVMTYALPWWIAVFLGAIIVAILAALLGLPLQRMAGPYFALGTLGLGIIFKLIWDLEEWDFIAGDTGGILLTSITEDPRIMYFIILAFLVVSIVVMISIGKSKMGTILKAIRDDETGAKGSGINVLKYKLIALMISAFFAGIAGGLYSQFIGVATTAEFDLTYTFLPIILVTIGGLTTISGAILGAFVYQIYDLIIAYVVELRVIIENPALHQFLVMSPTLLFGILILLIIRFAPNGTMNPMLDKLKKVWDLISGK